MKDKTIKFISNIITIALLILFGALVVRVGVAWENHSTEKAPTEIIGQPQLYRQYDITGDADHVRVLQIYKASTNKGEVLLPTVSEGRLPLNNQSND